MGRATYLASHVSHRINRMITYFSIDNGMVGLQELVFCSARTTKCANRTTSHLYGYYVVAQCSMTVIDTRLRSSRFFFGERGEIGRNELMDVRVYTLMLCCVMWYD